MQSDRLTVRSAYSHPSPERRSSEAQPKRNKKPKADDVVISCEKAVTKAAAASRLRFGHSPEGRGRDLVIYTPHPGPPSLYYKAGQQMGM